MRKQTVYAAKNAKNNTHFFKLLEKHNIQVKPSFKKGQNGQQEIRGFSFEMRNKDGSVIAVSSGSKLNRKLLTKNALEQRFSGITKQIIQRQDQKQTTLKTVKNKAPTTKQAVSTSNKSVKKPSKAPSSTLPKKSRDIDKFADAETKKIQQYEQQKMAEFDAREAKRRAEQNEDSFGKMLLDDLKEAARKERLRLEQPTTFKASLLPKSEGTSISECPQDFENESIDSNVKNSKSSESSTSTEKRVRKSRSKLRLTRTR